MEPVSGEASDFWLETRLGTNKILANLKADGTEEIVRLHLGRRLSRPPLGLPRSHCPPRLRALPIRRLVCPLSTFLPTSATSGGPHRSLVALRLLFARLAAMARMSNPPPGEREPK